MSESSSRNWLYTGISAAIALSVGVVAYTINNTSKKESKKNKKNKKLNKLKNNKEKNNNNTNNEESEKENEGENINAENMNSFSTLNDELKYKKLLSVLKKSLSLFFPQLVTFRRLLRELVTSNPSKYKTIDSILFDLNIKDLPRVLTNDDKFIIEYIRSLLTLPKDYIDKISLVTKFIIVIYITLYHSARYIEKKAIAIGEMRNDYELIISLLKLDMKNIKNMTFDEQYSYVIFMCWLASRTQNGPILVELLNASVPLLTAEHMEMDIMCVPQLICAASLVGRWNDVIILGDLMKKSNPAVFKERCDDYHEFAKNHPRLYLDLQQIYDLSSVESALPIDTASQLIFSKYNWQQATIRSGRFRNDKDSDWENLSFTTPHTLIRTGLIDRMSSDISSLLNHYDGNMILSGSVTDNRICLSGYDYALNDEDLPIFYCRDQLQLVPKQLTTAEGLSKEFWVGTYTHTKEKVQNDDCNQIEVLEETQHEEKEAIDDPLANVLEVIRKKIELKKKNLVENISIEIELEFSPFTNILEHPKEIYFNFGDDLVRFTNLIDTITRQGN